MSIIANFSVLQRPWKGYEDPGLPVGMWIAQGTILGDASGGSQAVVFDFKQEGEPLGARFFNLEQVEVHATRAAVRKAALILQNFDIVGPTGLVNREILLELDTDSVTTAVLRSGDLKLPIFIGRPQLVDLLASLLFSTANFLNETFFATAQGYIWEPRSLLSDGGLRRPPDSLYG